MLRAALFSLGDSLLPLCRLTCVQVYSQYIRWLAEQLPKLSDAELFEKPYWDYLQSPLQPLMDNLESQTYETFERDPIKYKVRAPWLLWQFTA